MKYLTIRNNILDVTLGLAIATFGGQAHAQGCGADPSQAGRADFTALDALGRSSLAEADTYQASISRLVRPGTAPIARAVIRPTPNGLLIPARDPLPPGSTP